MITLYTTSSCLSCRKAKRWLEKNNLPYKERNILEEPMKKEEIKQVLQLTENGVVEIIATTSRIFAELNIEVEMLSLKEVYQLIEETPEIVQHPILIDNKRVQIGYHEDEIHRFLPRSVRNFDLQQLLKRIK